MFTFIKNALKVLSSLFVNTEKTVTEEATPVAPEETVIMEDQPTAESIDKVTIRQLKRDLEQQAKQAAHEARCAAIEKAHLEQALAFAEEEVAELTTRVNGLTHAWNEMNIRSVMVPTRIKEEFAPIICGFNPLPAELKPAFAKAGLNRTAIYAEKGIIRRTY